MVAIDKDIDNPAKNTKRAKISRVLEESFPVLFVKELGHCYVDAFDDYNFERLINKPAALFMTGGVFFGALAHMPFLNVETTVLPTADSSYAFQAVLDENGYLATSSDSGATGYALFHEDDMYRLYSFSQAYKKNGQLILTLEQEADDAWYLARRMAQDYGSLSVVAEDVNARLATPHWESFSFESVSQFVVEDSGTVHRFAGALINQDDAYESIGQQYTVLGNAWRTASLAMQDGHTGMSQEYRQSHAGAYSTEFHDFSAERNTDEWGFGIGGAGALLLMLSASLGVAERRRKIKDSKDAKLKRGLRP